MRCARSSAAKWRRIIFNGNGHTAEWIAKRRAAAAPVDHLEMIVDSGTWPMPTYGELLFNV